MGSIFSKGGGTEDFKPANISAGGITTRGSDRIRLSTSSDRQGLVGQIASTFPRQANVLAGLRERVAPGFSDLRRSRLAGLESNRRRTVGDLREGLARRRVLGSSFARDTITRANREFQQEEDRIRAESFLTELELTHALANEEFDVRRGEFQTSLDELNLQAEIATQLATAATAQLGANARLKSELNASSASGFGKLLGFGASLLF